MCEHSYMGVCGGIVSSQIRLTLGKLPWKVRRFLGGTSCHHFLQSGQVLLVTNYSRVEKTWRSESSADPESLCLFL